MTSSSIIYTSPFPDQEIPEVALTGYVLQRAKEIPDRVAMIDGGTGNSYTFAELSDNIHRLAGGLTEAGFGSGTTIGLMASNCPEYAIIFHAVAVAGGTVTTINPVYGPGEIRQQLIDAKATMLMATDAFIDTAVEAAIDTEVTDVYSIGDFDGQMGGGSQTKHWSDLFGDAIEQVEISPIDHVVVLPYSSGTTGLAKGVMLTHYNCVANLVQSVPVLTYEESGETALAVLPFFHIYGMQVLMNDLLSRGVTVVTMPRFDMEMALSLVQEHSITRFFAVPPIVLGLAKHPLVDSYDVSSIKQVFCAAAPLGADLAEEAAARLGCVVVQGYGMTELSPVSHASVVGDLKPGSNGPAIPNTECRIIDSEGVDQPAGEPGELLVRGPQVMMGYLNNTEATDATIDSDGWLHTGDVSYIDEDGHMFIIDRVKELIKYKGFQVPPAELEALLITHPAVADVAVIGVPDVEAGELPKAFIVLKPGVAAEVEDLQAFVADSVATYKQIRLVEFTDEIPKSASGKILRRLLRDQS